jgi:tRNA 2-thiouridine synthesizing protein A
MSDKPTVTIDLSGLPCPAPLLGAKKIIDDLQAGQTMLLLSDCPGSNDDLLAWCKFTGNEMLSNDKRSDGKTAYLLRKAGGASTTPIAHATLDMRGVTCPGPILEAKKLLDGMKSGEVLQLVSDCPGAPWRCWPPCRWRATPTSSICEKNNPPSSVQGGRNHEYRDQRRRKRS